MKKRRGYCPEPSWCFYIISYKRPASSRKCCFRVDQLEKKKKIEREKKGHRRHQIKRALYHETVSFSVQTLVASQCRVRHIYLLTPLLIFHWCRLVSICAGAEIHWLLPKVPKERSHPILLLTSDEARAAKSLTQSVHVVVSLIARASAVDFH